MEGFEILKRLQLALATMSAEEFALCLAKEPAYPLEHSPSHECLPRNARITTKGGGTLLQRTNVRPNVSKTGKLTTTVVSRSKHMRGTSSSSPLEHRPAHPLEQPPLNPLERPRSCHLEKWFFCVTCVSVFLCHLCASRYHNLGGKEERHDWCSTLSNTKQ